ncbi:MoxR family ATPase [Chromobacterium sp. ASV23]|uniref:AAA family ATPase n=1 Tax=Chromobacterium sp. ASV23 TaxID=2795110 RepID=UPI0018EBF878|nr:MoxR family ATPase [Chromobacterium sp. ASV23]
MTATAADTIDCQLCGAKVHAMKIHLRDSHPEVTLEQYQEAHPSAPIHSPYALERIREATAAKEAAVSASTEFAAGKAPLHEVFKLGAVKGAMSARGTAIMINILDAGEFTNMVPKKDDGYVYDIPNLKDVLLALEVDIPCYIWGHAGTGKTTLVEQVCARTNRPMLRVQHTVNTEESHIIGAKTVRDGQVLFDLGPLALAMKHGWTYVADEYDFAQPSVLSVYQPVLEGKALVIKEADHENMVIEPHPNFRFVATGNTNGTGDETGLYVGTSVQNEANYDRFGMVIHKKYMPEEEEAKILQFQGGLELEDAKRMVTFATKVREAYDARKISKPISPRTLIFASVIGVCRGNLRAGVERSFMSKLTSIDYKVVEELAQRVLG